MGLTVLMLDGNSAIGAHVSINMCYLICLRQLIRSRENLDFFSEKTCSELPCNIITMKKIDNIKGEPKYIGIKGFHHRKKV